MRNAILVNAILVNAILVSVFVAACGGNSSTTAPAAETPAVRSAAPGAPEAARTGESAPANAAAPTGPTGPTAPTAPTPPTASTEAREVHVSRADVQALLTGAGGTDLTPVVEGGKQVGMRLVNAGAGTTAARLGAATGDIIYSIAGHALDSIPAAYRAGDLAARESRIEIRGSRDGAPYTLVLVVDR